MLRMLILRMSLRRSHHRCVCYRTVSAARRCATWRVAGSATKSSTSATKARRGATVTRSQAVDVNPILGIERRPIDYDSHAQPLPLLLLLLLLLLLVLLLQLERLMR